MSDEADPGGKAGGPGGDAPGACGPCETQGDACTRRRLLANAALVSGVVATAGSVAYPFGRFLLPPEEAESSVASMVAGPVAEFPVNTGRIVRMGSKPVLVIHLPGGEFRAFSAKCTHLSCLVKYRPDTKQIFCACHGGAFDLTGKNVAGPPPRPLEAYSVSVRGEKDRAEVVVTRAS